MARSLSLSRFAVDRTVDTDAASLHRPSACANVTAALLEGIATDGTSDESPSFVSIFAYQVAGSGRDSALINPGVRVALCALYLPYTTSSSFTHSPCAPSTMPWDAYGFGDRTLDRSRSPTAVDRALSASSRSGVMSGTSSGGSWKLPCQPRWSFAAVSSGVVLTLDTSPSGLLRRVGGIPVSLLLLDAPSRDSEDPDATPSAFVNAASCFVARRNASLP
mmetsp:Transcript_7760/g.35166  ORF Transcript_7760/g.35166 Transcript_7760/m.35166 type:complete len:220 (-) Transcript_7760:147-806(-)